jgi:PTH2 family peptidyl-tRNA hydrolase
MKPVMYIIANRGLGMSPGKLAAQVAHAAVEAYRISKPELLEAWYVGGHYTKIVLAAEDADQLAWIANYIEDRGFKTSFIIDEGRTEIKPFTPTAVGVEVVDKEDPHVAATFGEFRVYKEPKPQRQKTRFERFRDWFAADGETQPGLN